jgi:hypothetical protein
MGVIGVAVIGTIGSSIYGAYSANQQAKDAQGKMNNANRAIAELEANRQEIIDPYAGFQNVSNIAQDLSGMMSNAYANLGVSTKAAEIQAEETDIALANTLDTLRATGASAGGATALAQAAARSKKGVSATIEKQEADNDRLRAQGEMQLQDRRISEKQRLQGIQMSEAIRMQNADAQGNIFQFETQEQRDNQKLNRLAGLSQGYQAQQAASKSARDGAIASGISGLTSIATSGMGGQPWFTTT